jgi:hypothetical protein
MINQNDPLPDLMSIFGMTPKKSCAYTAHYEFNESGKAVKYYSSECGHSRIQQSLAQTCMFCGGKIKAVK